MKKTIYTLFAMLAFANFTMAQVPSYVPTDSLKGWWGFNGNANDASGNGNNGTVNGATLTSDRFGNINNSYLFDGISNNISFSLTSINNTFPSSSGSTSSIWIKSLDSNGPLISMQGSGEYVFHIGTLADIVQSNGNYGILVRDNCCGTGNNIFGSNPVDNSWHMLTIVRLANGSLKLYKDGVLEVTSASGQNGTITFNPLYMAFGADKSWVYGAQNGCNSCNSVNQQHYNGKLDDIGIWTRALTSTEISNLYRGCLADTITTQPTNQVGNKGSNKTISFAHSGTGNSYQWQSNAAVLGWQNVPNITSYTGATTNSLTVNNLSVSNHNQLFRVVTFKSGCKDTSNTVSLTLANIATDSLRLLRLQADSSRLTNESIVYLARINKLMNDSAYYTSRILKLSNDSVFYVNRIAKLTNDSVYYNGRITKLISDSNVFVARINKLSNDSIYYLSRINKLSNDSVYYNGRITKLISDSNVFVARINKLSYDSLTNLGRITNLKIDSINNKTTISLLNADIVTKGNIITFLQLDSTNKGITIRQLQTDLANKHDTVYIASVITSDTLRIAIRTGILSTSPIINSLKVYPNPASTLLYIDLEKPGYFIAKLSSITGQSIITPTSGTIDVSSLANGVYILSIYDSNNKLISTNKVAIIK